MSKRWPDKTIIGLTGNIATGKSVVRRMLEHLGAFGIDADGLAHRAMSPGAPAYQPIVETFGRWILTSEGQIDRQRLGQVVFADAGALALLEKITHPIVAQVIDLLIRRAKQKVVVIEAIKLIEAGLADMCDTVWVVDTPIELQVQRLVRDRKLSEAEARTRIGAQPPQSAKLARANVVIDNSGGYEETYNQVQRAFNKLVGIEEAPPEPEPVIEVPAGEISVRRGGPKQAEDIALFINRVQGVSLTRTDILLRFGQKAYSLAYAGTQVIGLAGWQVENLIARVDEFIVAPNAPIDKAVSGLLEVVERSANDLQSEIAMIFLKNNTPDSVRQAILSTGYEQKVPADLRVPDWREAAQDSAPQGTYMLVKRLRADRVLKPI